MEIHSHSFHFKDTDHVTRAWFDVDAEYFGGIAITVGKTGAYNAVYWFLSLIGANIAPDDLACDGGGLVSASGESPSSLSPDESTDNRIECTVS